MPFLFGQEVDREIGSEAVPHVGEKEIQCIQRASGGVSGLSQAKPSRLQIGNPPTRGSMAGSRGGEVSNG
jgi:hypothetical protein